MKTLTETTEITALAGLPSSKVDQAHLFRMFPEERGTALDMKRRSYLSIQFKRYCARVGVTGKSFHCLHHALVQPWQVPGDYCQGCGSFGHRYHEGIHPQVRLERCLFPMGSAPPRHRRMR